MKHLKFILLFLLVSILFSSTRCSDNKTCHYSIIILNNSNKAIYFNISFRYPDTTLDSNPTFDSSFKIENQSQKVDKYGRCLEGDFSYTSKIMCFIYDAQTIETTPWDTVKAKYLVLKRYDLSLKDLENINWSVTYP